MRRDETIDSKQYPSEVDCPSHAAQLIERIKRSQLRPGQFRLSTLFIGISTVAIILAAVRLSGGSYLWFFVACLGGTYVFLPFLAWLAAAFLRVQSRRNRYAFAGIASVFGIAALSIGAVFYPPLREVLLVVSSLSIVFWPLTAFWAHALDLEVYGGTRNRDPNSFWSRFLLTLTQFTDQGSQGVFRCSRCQQIRPKSERLRRKHRSFCHDCYLLEIRTPEEIEFPDHDGSTS